MNANRRGNSGVEKSRGEREEETIIVRSRRRGEKIAYWRGK